jgi:hypothetical protein
MKRLSRTKRPARTLPLVVLGLLAASIVSAVPAHAAISDIRVHLSNDSDVVLSFASYTLDSGCWVEKPVNGWVVPGQTIDIASAACDLGTDTEFHVSYYLGTGGQKISLHYSNPLIGSDTFEEAAPPTYVFTSSGVIEDRTARLRCDSPCDGIPLDWKKNGVTIDPGGGNPPQFVDLPKMGVSLDRPNVLVQLDWMEDASHDKQLRQAAIDAVIAAFDKDPVTHAGATRSGITLIVDAGSDSTIAPGGANWGSLSRAKPIPWKKYLLTGNRDAGYQQAPYFTLHKNNFVPTGRLPIFHYSVAADVISQDMRPTPPVDDSTSGLAPSGWGFMVTLGAWADTQAEETGTFMHELGHVLGLGGDNNVPNYPSIMNYTWQTVGVFRGGVQVFDYLRDNIPEADENTLMESSGINLGSNASNNGTNHRCKTASGDIRTIVQPNLSPVDWDCDGKTPNGGTGFDSDADGSKSVLPGYTSDWSRINFRRGGVGAGINAKDTVKVPSSGVSTSHRELTYEEARLIQVLPLDTTLSYTGASAGHYHDLANMSATLLDPGDSNSPIQGKTITFQIGSSLSDTCSATTDSTGVASCSIRLSQVPGLYNVTASFTGDSMYAASSDLGDAFTIGREETSLTYNGPPVILAGSGSSVSAKLVEGGANSHDDEGSLTPSPSGQVITFTLGAQSCSGITDATGVASCFVPGASWSTLGPKPLTVSFAGDAFYLPSWDQPEVIVFAFPSRGAFVVGDATVATAAPGASVTWWNDGWWLNNSLSGGVAPDSFKGFAQRVTTLPATSPTSTCGNYFVTQSGNSPPPTSLVPSYMGVIVASSVSKTGAGVNGVWGSVVVVKTDSGYSPSPGHVGTGTIVATFC